ncbi:hypothetical protein KSP40_PGU022027 [Platanthera guangdongensis]|uniref:SUI1 domain-containing protein n=1 Tax=Platanthera guangdongensis TaxID=2320717 RepID=A0ABR2MLB2_9ASPA
MAGVVFIYTKPAECPAPPSRICPPLLSWPIDSHIGGVNDIGFWKPNNEFFMVTCGDDKTIKVRKISNRILSVNVLPSDPFAEANADNAGAGSKEYVHIRVQQRNGRKSLTTVQGLKKAFSKTKILKDLKKEFCCNGTVVEDPELGQAGIVKEQIKIHGF